MTDNFRRRQTIRVAVALLILSGLALSCSGKRVDKAGGANIDVVATTCIIADMIRNIAGERATVRGLMGPGTDPHLYKATQGDIGALAGADIIFYNGLHLEGKMTEILERMSERISAVAVSDGIPREQLRSPEGYTQQYDPHVWFDLTMWSRAVERAAQSLSQFDPNAAAFYTHNAELYRDSLARLHKWVRSRINEIPESHRVMITAHDAFGYFGRAYGLEVQGLQGISTASEFGLNDVTALVDLLVERRIKAVFVESSVSKRSIEAVVEGCRARGHMVKIGGELFSDALGPADSPAGDYLGMIRHNVNTIVEALK